MRVGLDDVLFLFSLCFMERETLATYPFVSVRIACRNCTRRGSYRLARLAERFGADASLDDVLMQLSADCGLAANRSNHPGCRRVYLPDLETPRRQPDVPAE
jgi:hypothetical protein